MRITAPFLAFCILCTAFGAGSAWYTRPEPAVIEIPVLSLGAAELSSARPAPTHSAQANPFVPTTPRTPRAQPATTSTPQTTTFPAPIRIFAAGQGSSDTTLADACKKDLLTAASLLPAQSLASLSEVRLFLTSRPSRGMANANIIELQCADIVSSERIAVLVHEMGHTVDLGYLTGAGTPSPFQDGDLPVGTADSSSTFYAISWKTTTEKRIGMKKQDFVSGYAMSNPFEDFAESFAYFVLHGDAFRQLATENATLAKKYAFLRDTVFSGSEFSGGTAPENGKRPWDITLLPHGTTPTQKIARLTK